MRPNNYDKLRLSVVYLPTEELQIPDDNPRIHSDKQIAKIARSYEQFGVIGAIIIDDQKRVFAGCARLEAARQKGLKEVPTIMVDHLNESQKRAFRLADNRIQEDGEWHRPLLADQFEILSGADLDFSLEVTGFEVPEIDVLLEEASEVSLADTDEADALPEKKEAPVSKPGDLWLLGKNRVFCGNSLEEKSFSVLMQDCLAAIVFSDAPYNLNVNHIVGLGKTQHRNFQMAAGEMSESQFTDFLTKVCNLMAKYSHDGSFHYLFMDWRHGHELQTAGKHIYSELKNVCVWVKDNAGMGSFYRSQHEMIFVFKNGNEPHRNNIQLGKFGRNRSNVWRYPGVNSFSRKTEEGNLLELHPTVKPVSLVADALMDASARGDIVLDPFLGSGTTVLAAERTGRRCYGIELDPLYVDVIIRRWQKFTGLSATHATTNRTFNEMEEELEDASKEDGRESELKPVASADVGPSSSACSDDAAVSIAGLA